MALKNKIAGGLSSKNYWQIRINKQLYESHRLAWLYIYGYFPENQIDHINQNRSDNRIKNLRESSRQCQIRNSKKHINNTSGVTGVCWAKDTQKWQAQITVNLKLYYLGQFYNFTEAVAHRLVAEQCLNWAGCNSSSSAYQYMQNYLKREGIMLCPFTGKNCVEKRCQLWVEADSVMNEGNCSFQWLARAAIDKVYFFDKEDKE